MSDTRVNASLHNLIVAAFKAGFMASAEGWNGEYPCPVDEAWLNNAAEKAAAEAFAGIAQ